MLSVSWLTKASQCSWWNTVEDVLEIKPDVVIYMDEGRVVYQGDVAGLMETVDYHRIKLPAPIVVKRAAMDPQPVFKAAVQPGVPNEPLVCFDRVSFRYQDDLPDVLKNLNFSINKGDVITILGHNGSGKTAAMVKHALGLLKPTEGRVLLEGQDTRQSTVAQAAHTIGYVFQSPTQMLFAPTVAEELAFGPKNLKMSTEKITQNVNW